MALESPMVDRVCLHCGAAFQAYLSAVRHGEGKYCSRVCADRGKQRPLAERFWERVDTSGDCWLWTGTGRGNGYGGLSVNGKNRSAHRIAWELTNGAIPDGLFVCHRCDNPACVRPEHLFLGTPRANIQDMMAKGRARFGDAPPGKGRATLTPESVREVRRLATQGQSQRALARRYGVRSSAIYKLLHGITWKNLKDE